MAFCHSRAGGLDAVVPSHGAIGARLGWNPRPLGSLLVKEVEVSAQRLATTLAVASILFATLAKDGSASTPGLPTSLGATGTTLGCEISGVSNPAIKTAIEDQRGKVIAEFSGSPTSLAVRGLPPDASGRAPVVTGLGTGGFRIRGFVSVSALPLFTRTTVDVVPSHLWIDRGVQVSFLQARPNRVQVARRVSGSLDQTFQAWTECSALALSPIPAGNWTPPEDARGYVLRSPSLVLFADPTPTSPSIATLRRSQSSEGLLLYVTEKSGDRVHVHWHGPVVVDAWAMSARLEALAEGEIVDQPPASSEFLAPARFALPQSVKQVRPLREVTLRGAPKDVAAPIGVIEPGTETLVVDQVANWASVLPKSLNVVPPSGGGFWAKSSDLGLIPSHPRPRR